MFSITTIPPAIEKLNEELTLLARHAFEETPRGDETTREIEMIPEWSADFSLQPNEFGAPKFAE